MIPTPYSIPLKKRTLGSPDGRNDRQESWDTAGYVRAHGIAGPDQVLNDPNRVGYRVDWVIHAPREVVGKVEHRDKLTIKGKDCLVVKVLDWTCGPWNFPAAGVEIHVQEVEG